MNRARLSDAPSRARNNVDAGAHRGLTCSVVRLPCGHPAVLRPAQRRGEQQEAQQVLPSDLPHHGGADGDDGGGGDRIC